MTATSDPDPDYTSARLTAIGRQIDLAVSDAGRHFSRRMIGERYYIARFADGYERGYQAGLVAAHEENRQAMEALLAGEVDG